MNHRLNRLTALGIIMLIAAILTGCGPDREPVIPDADSDEDLSEYITLAEYKGLEYEKKDNQVSDEEIQDYINNEVNASGAASEIKTGKIKKDSVVNIDYTGSLNGVEFDGGSATDVELDIADNNYIDGFAEALIGHEAGETFDINVTFPENYGNTDLAGQPAVFKITVNYLVETTVPEYNDEWVSNNTEYTETKEYEAAVREELMKNKIADSQNDERLEVFNQIYDNTEVISYPDEEYKAKYDKLTSSYREYAEANNKEFEDYLENDMGISLKEFEDMAKDAAETALKRELILKAIAAEEGISTDESEYKTYLLELLDEAGYTEESYKAEKGYTIEEYADKNDIFVSFLYRKVMDKVMEYSVEK